MMTTGILSTGMGSKGMGSKGKLFLAAAALLIGGLLAGTAQATVINVTNEGGDAGNRNSFGYYIKGIGGIPTKGQVIWGNTTVNGANPTTVGTMFTIDLDALGVTASQIGYFLIPNGGGFDNPFTQTGTLLNSTLANNQAVVFFQDSGQGFPNAWTVALDTDGSMTHNAGDITLFGLQSGFDGAPAFFSDSLLNPDPAGTGGAVHVLPTGDPGVLAPFFGGNQHYEDLVVTAQQLDYNDSNFTISVVPEPGTLVLFLFGLLGLGILARRRAVSA